MNLQHKCGLNINMKIKDIIKDEELLADLRNKLTPIVNLFALIEGGLTIEDNIVKQELEFSKKIINKITHK